MSAKSRSLTALLFALLTLIVGVSAIHAQSDTAANKAAAAKLFQLYTDAAHIGEVSALIAPDFVIHTEMGDMPWEAMQGAALALIQAVPDVKYTPLVMVADGDVVAVRYEMTGTFTNPLPDFTSTTGAVLQPTGKPITLFSNAILTFNADGLMTSYDEKFDNLEFGIQLGQVPEAMRMTPPITAPDASVWTMEQTTPEFAAQLKDLVYATNPEAYNNGNVAAFDTLYAADYVSYPSMVGLDASKSMIVSLRAAMSDFHTEGTLVIAEGNWVVYSWTLTGTFNNVLNMNGLEVQPTGKPVSYSGIVFAKVNADGKIVADWNEIDNVEIAMQYGLMGQ